MIKEFVVAEKEFRDILTSKRFLAIFAILIVLCIVGMISGLSSYNQQLDQYKSTQQQRASDPGYQQQLQQMQQQLDQMKANGASQDDIKSMEYNIQNQQSGGYMMPSMTTVFYSVMNPFYMVGMALAIAMGFDLISRERDEGSLKSLLSHPIFRDSIINGKAIAAIVSLALAIGATFLVVIAIMLFSGVVPAGDDLDRILAFFGVTVLYCVVFLGIAIMVSTLVKNSTMSILCILGIFLIAYSLPTISYQVADFVAGPPPEQSQYMYNIYVQPNQTVTIGNHTYTAEEAQQYNDEINRQNQANQWRYQNESNAYFQRVNAVQSAINILSPMSDYQDLQASIINNNKQITNPFGDFKPWEWDQKVSLWESLSYKWGSLVALLVMAILSFAVSYVAFMRMDVR